MKSQSINLKPHLRYEGGLWEARFMHRFGYGESPLTAWQNLERVRRLFAVPLQEVHLTLGYTQEGIIWRIVPKKLQPVPVTQEVEHEQDVEH